MAEWEHQSCGAICVGTDPSPPESCWYCLSLQIRVIQQRGGWRLIDREAAQKKAKRTKGKPVTPSRRDLVYARDRYQCVQCGEDDSQELTLDHIRPKSKGGTNALDNLQTLCRRCNNLKADLLPPKGQTWPVELAA